MKVTKVHDYAADESTQTVQVISAVTKEGCIVTEREFEYTDLGTGAVQVGTEITLEVPHLNTEEQVYRTLEDLAASEITADEMTLVED